MFTGWRFFADLAERSTRTFLQAYLGYWLTLGGADADTLFTVHNLQVGLCAAALAVATAVGAKGVGGDHSSASVLPAAQPAQPAAVDDGARRELDQLLERLQHLPPIGASPSASPSSPMSTVVMQMPPPGPLSPPNLPPLAGGRDPDSDGNR